MGLVLAFVVPCEGIEGSVGVGVADSRMTGIGTCFTFLGGARDLCPAEGLTFLDLQLLALPVLRLVRRLEPDAALFVGVATLLVVVEVRFM